MADYVNTALGPVSADQLGITSMHEHLLLGMPGWEFDASFRYDREAVAKLCIEKVNEAKSLGLNTIVDATPMDLCRDIELYKMVQEATSVNIISSTGLYTVTDGNLVFWKLLAAYRGYDEALNRLTYTYTKEVTEGIGDTGVKAGVIKIATGKEIAQIEEISIHAAALTQQKTGVRIISHTAAPSMGKPTAETLLAKGADPSKTMIGHMCDTPDPQLIIDCLDLGFYVGLDRFGLTMSISDEEKCRVLAELIERGYINKLLLGHDCQVFNQVTDLIPEAMLANMPDWNLSGLFRTLIPRMKKDYGITDEQIHTLFVENPRRFFSGE
ncbi:MAG: phosphotriesterase [Solobacterium sp.]|nr:phosphotriesterase [Solobacterium sp.]